MDDDLDFFAAQAGGNAGFSTTPNTGEVFYMNHPGNHPSLPNWNKLVRAIRDAGGTVVEHNAVNETHETRNPMFTRDTGVLLHVNGRKAFVHSDVSGDLMRTRTRDEVEAITRHDALGSIQKIPVDGDLEGGNLIYSPHHRTLFVGMSEHEFGNHIQRVYCRRNSGDPEAERAAAIFEKMVSPEEALSKTEQAWVDGLRDHYRKIREDSLQNLTQAVEGFNKQLLEEGAIASLEEGIQVMPVHVKQEMAFPRMEMPQGLAGRYFFHLDNLMNVLPSGQAVICEEALEHSSLVALKSHLADPPSYKISADEAEQGVTNFITVGDKIVTNAVPLRASDPNKPMLGEWFKQQGYGEVITAQNAGATATGWRFADGGFVRCATQKLTEDIGFPSPEQGKAGQVR